MKKFSRATDTNTKMDPTGTSSNDEEWMAFLTSQENSEWGHQSAELLEWSKQSFMKEMGEDGEPSTESVLEHTATGSIVDDELNEDIKRIVKLHGPKRSKFMLNRSSSVILEVTNSGKDAVKRPRRKSWFGAIRKSSFIKRKGRGNSTSSDSPHAVDSPTHSSVTNDLIDEPDPLLLDLDESSCHDGEDLSESSCFTDATDPHSSFLPDWLSSFGALPSVLQTDSMWPRLAPSKSQDDSQEPTALTVPPPVQWEWYRTSAVFNRASEFAGWAGTMFLDAMKEVGKYGTRAFSSAVEFSSSSVASRNANPNDAVTTHNK